MSDRKSTGNLRKHARLCWGDDIVKGVDVCADLNSAQEGLAKATKLRDGSITMAFERKGKESLSSLFTNTQKLKPGLSLFVQPLLSGHT